MTTVRVASAPVPAIVGTATRARVRVGGSVAAQGVEAATVRPTGRGGGQLGRVQGRASAQADDRLGIEPADRLGRLVDLVDLRVAADPVEHLDRPTGPFQPGDRAVDQPGRPDAGVGHDHGSPDPVR